MRKPATVVLAATALVFAAPAGADAGITITSPQDGATIAAGGSLPVSGEVEFIEPVPTDRQFFLRRTGCNEDKRLSTTQGSETSGCAYTASITPLNEDSRLADLWPAVDGVPFTLDAARALRGVHTLSSYAPPNNVGAGLTTIDIAAFGTLAGGSQVGLGSTSVSYTALPGQPYSRPWEIDLPDQYDTRDFSSFTLSTTVRGVNALHGFTTPNASHTTVPIYSASFDRAVELQLDAGPWVPIDVSEDLSTFQGAAPVCFCERTHTITARARQGAQVVGTDSVTINVTP